MQDKSDAIQRATSQLDLMEQLMTSLMADVDFNELKMLDRCNLTLKLMTQHMRTLKLCDDIRSDKDQPAQEQAFFGHLQRHLRGEASEADLDDPEMGFGTFFREGV